MLQGRKPNQLVKFTTLWLRIEWRFATERLRCKRGKYCGIGLRCPTWWIFSTTFTKKSGHHISFRPRCSVCHRTNVLRISINSSVVTQELIGKAHYVLLPCCVSILHMHFTKRNPWNPMFLCAKVQSQVLHFSPCLFTEENSFGFFHGLWFRQCLSVLHMECLRK